MIRRLDWLKQCGFFENYKWDPKLPDLARINVIFGANGTGKTSLAAAFDGLRYPPKLEGFKRVSFTIDNGSLRTSNGADDVVFDRVHVFSEEYISRSHNFKAGRADMPAVLTIGEKPVDAELQLEKLHKQLTADIVNRDQQAKAERDAQKTIEDTYKTISQQVVDAVGNAGGRWSSKSKFNINVVRAAFAGSHTNWASLTDEDVKKYLSIANSDRLEVIPITTLPTTPTSLYRRLQGALGTTPVTMVLDSIKAHPEAASWVDEGRRLHVNIDECLFCGSPLSQNRRDLIDGHFSHAVEKLQAELRAIRSELKTVLAEIGESRASLPSKGLFFVDLRARFDVADSQVRQELADLEGWVNEMLDRTEKKLSNVLTAVNANDAVPPVVSATSLLDLRSENNQRIAQHEQLVNDAAQKVELHYLKSAESNVRTSESAAKAAKSRVQTLDESITRTKSEIAELETVDGDPMPSANVLTTEVARLLGRDELKFELADGRYLVTRDGAPAQGLSLGERTAITLVHFLEQVAKFDATKGKPIVVIDDPVSSLDSEIFMGVSTYIWTEAVVKDHIAQLILLTHNFELFRQWDIQIEGLQKSKFKSEYPAEFYEIRPRYRTQNGIAKRYPSLVKWPPSSGARKKFRSTYLHGFIALVEARNKLETDDSPENRLDAQLLFPNVIRRVLESFLAFKLPNSVGDFNSSMRESSKMLKEAGYKGDADFLRSRLTRYAHAYSHNESPASDVIVNPDEVSSAISSAFEFMNCLDPVHFTGLCKVIDVDPTSLLP